MVWMTFSSPGSRSILPSASEGQKFGIQLRGKGTSPINYCSAPLPLGILLTVGKRHPGGKEWETGREGREGRNLG